LEIVLLHEKKNFSKHPGLFAFSSSRVGLKKEGAYCRAYYQLRVKNS